MTQPHPAITEKISETSPEDHPLPTETQPAYHAVIHVVVPGTHVGGEYNGQPIGEAGAADYIAETLRGLFLDWQYVSTDFEGDGNFSLQTPIHITVSKPYVEGTFLADGVES